MERYRVLVLGDFHFGESYARGGARILAEHGYGHSTVNLRPFVDSCDSVVVNLETPLVRPDESPSPFTGQKTYVHWGDPVATGRELRNLGVDAVSLANNHTMDHGHEGLEATFHALSDLGIQWFGAGRTLEEARMPYRVILPDRVGGGELHFHGSFQYSKRSDEDFGFYAGEESSGCAPLSVANVPWARHEGTTQEDSFQVAFPHWGANYVWRGRGQYRLAHRFLRKDYDLVLGHGGHNMQEVHRKQQRWVVYGIGNGNFQSGGRWQRYEQENGILPFSFWAVLEVQRQDGRRWVDLKLYPVYSDNSLTNFQPSPVSEPDFNRVLDTLRSRPTRPWRFDNPAQSAGQDDLGFFISLSLGAWPEGNRPARLKPVLKSGDPGDWPLRSPDPELEDHLIKQPRAFFGAAMLALHAERNGGSTHWLTSHLVLIESDGRRFLVDRHARNESSLGAAICQDKGLTANFLGQAGVATPESLVVGSANKAVEAASFMGGPVVVKPLSGIESQGVTTGLVRADEIREAFTAAHSADGQVLLQKHVDAAEAMRVLASPSEAIAVNRLVLPHVTGDGDSTIGQLIDDKNQQRNLNPLFNKRPIPIDTLTHRQLNKQGLSLDHVLELGQTATVRNVAGLSDGADPHQALETANPVINQIAKAAVAAIPGLSWGEVDLLRERYTGKPYVVGIDNRIGYGQALFPTYGTPKDVVAKVWELRQAATEPEVRTAPEPPDLRADAESFALTCQTGADSGTLSFMALFDDSLARQGYHVNRKKCQLLDVTSSQGEKTWVTTGGLTSADRVVAGLPLKRHSWTRKFLEMAGLPLPRARAVTSPRQLRRFAEGRVNHVALLPIADSWKGPDAHVLTVEEIVEKSSLPTRMLVQARPRGQGVRVLATREKAWAIITGARPRPLSEASLLAVSNLAVQAVRAVPELRWAAVDVLVRRRPTQTKRPQSAMLVEGLTRAPEFSTNDHLIAGDFDAFVRWIVESPAFTLMPRVTKF